MSVFILKIIAMITMVVDHLGGPFFNNNMVMRCVGRFAFVIYAFLLAEGFRHIRSSANRVETHLSKLVVLAFVSEFCYDLLEEGFNIGRYMSSQNNIITLLLAFMGLLAIEHWKKKPTAVVCAVALTSFCTYAMSSNYKIAGVLLVYAFYAYLNYVTDDSGRPRFSYLKRLGLLLGIMAVYIPIYHWARVSFALGSQYGEAFIKYLPWYLTHIPIAALLAFYTGEVGYRKRWFGNFYSWFYPGHLLLLGIIRLLAK